MKAVVRLALPRLSALTPETPLPFVLLDRQHTILRVGELPLALLARDLPTRRTQLVLHTADVVHTQLTAPPLAGARLTSAVQALVEPMVRTSLDDVAIGHSRRRADGLLDVAWTARGALTRAWTMLAEAGFFVTGIYPTAHIAPTAVRVVPPVRQADTATPDALDSITMAITPAELALALPAGKRWCHPAPDWSLALAELRPTTHGDGRWRATTLCGAPAALVWILGLNLYARQLSHEINLLNTTMQQQIIQAFPNIGILIDPLKQVLQRRDSLRAAQGTPREDDFMPLAQAAAGLLAQANYRVEGLHYRNGVLSLKLQGDDMSDAAATSAQQRATALGLNLNRDENGWQLTRLDVMGHDQPRVRRRDQREGIR